MRPLIPALALAAFLLASGCQPSNGSDARGGGLGALFAQGGSGADEGVVARDSVTAVLRPLPVDFERINPFQGSLSRDATWWATTDWNTGDIVVLELAGDEERRVTGVEVPFMPGFGMAPWFSPDGEWVAFTWFDMIAEQAELHVGAVGGGDVRSVHQDESTTWVDVEDWSPDGSHILASLTRDDGTIQLVLAPADGGETVPLRSLGWSKPRGAAFSPDSRWVAFDFAPHEENRTRDIHVIAVDGSQGRALVEGPSDDWLLGWSPDGFLVFASDRNGTPGAWRLDVEDGRAAGAPELVKPDLWRVVPSGFDLEGRFYFGRVTGGSEVRLVGLDVEEGRLVGPATNVDPRAFGPTSQGAWSPDGRHLAYLVEEAPVGAGPLSDSSVRVRSLESGEVRDFRMPPRAHGLVNPRWTTDGRAIFLRAQYDRGGVSLLRLDVQTGEVVRVVQDVDLYPTFEVLPDARRIIHTESLSPDEVDLHSEDAHPGDADAESTPGPGTGLVGQRLVVRDLEDGSVVELHRHTARIQNPNITLWRLALSPDATQVAFTRTRAWGSEVPLGAGELVVMPLEGGEPRRVVEEIPLAGNGALAWTADGRGLLYVTLQHPDAGGGSILWHVELDGSPPREVARFDEGIQHIRPHPDGRRIAFGTGSLSAELWVMENLDPVVPRRVDASR